MARPRKDADAPDARTRIIEAFWELIENNSIFELSVGEVTRAAQCSASHVLPTPDTPPSTVSIPLGR